MDPTGHFVISGSTIALIVGIFALLATAGVITYGAVTDIPVVFDVSLSAGMGAGFGIKGGISLVWDIRKGEADLYPHFGVFAGIKCNTVGYSYSIGVVQNYVNRGDYAGPFTDIGVGYYDGFDFCFDPTNKKDGAKAASFTFGNNVGAYYGNDYYWWWKIW